MLVAEILKSKGEAVFAISPETPLTEACRELESRRVGALMVCEDDRVVGVLSERDVVRRCVLTGFDPVETAASAIMNRIRPMNSTGSLPGVRYRVWMVHA